MRPTHVAFIAASLLPAPAVFAQTYRYALISVDSLGNGPSVWISDINDSGDIAGESAVDDPDQGSHAFRWHEGITHDLGILAGEYAAPGRMNSFGDVVGDCRGYDENREYFDRATIWTRDGEVLPLDSDLGYDPHTRAYDINDLGEIVGSTDDPCIWRDGVRTNLPRFADGLEAKAIRINNNSTVAGFAGTPDGIRNGAIWVNAEQLQILPGLGGQYTVAWAINENGVVAGGAEDTAGRTRVVLWRNSQIEIVDEGLPPRAIVNVYDMNDFEEVVASVAQEFEAGRGIIRRNGQWTLLDDDLPPNSHFGVTYPRAINNLGMVAVVDEGDSIWEPNIGALLMPVNPTLSLSDPVPGIAGRVNTLTLTGATPNARIYFYYGLRGGGQVIPGCPVADLVALQIAAPIQAGSVRANANGTAVITGFVPDAARRADLVLLQCAVPSECRISQLVAFKFQ